MHQKREAYVVLFLFRIMGGFLLGIFFVIWQKNLFLEQIGYLNESTLRNLMEVTFQPRALFFYLCKRFFLEYLFLLLLSVSVFKKRGMDFVCVVSGIFQGIFLGVLSVRYGGRGVSLYVLAQFPGCLALIPFIYMLFLWNRQQVNSGQGQRLLFGMGLLLSAAWGQSYVNPFLLQKFLKSFFPNI